MGKESPYGFYVGKKGRARCVTAANTNMPPRPIAQRLVARKHGTKIARHLLSGSHNNSV